MLFAILSFLLFLVVNPRKLKIYLPAVEQRCCWTTSALIPDISILFRNGELWNPMPFEGKVKGKVDRRRAVDTILSFLGGESQSIQEKEYLYGRVHTLFSL